MAKPYPAEATKEISLGRSRRGHSERLDKLIHYANALRDKCGFLTTCNSVSSGGRAMLSSHTARQSAIGVVVPGRKFVLQINAKQEAGPALRAIAEKVFADMEAILRLGTEPEIPEYPPEF